MMMDLHIIPECYIDTKLCKALVPPTTRYNHQKGCSTVAKVMKEKFSGDFALGIVDKDKLVLDYFREFNVVKEIPDNIQLCKHREEANHYLIFIRPTMEKWIINCANISNVDMNDFDLPNDFRDLMKITKTSKSENDDMYSSNFRSLFKEFRKVNSSLIAILTFWIEYLKDNPYDADLGHIQEKTSEILEG